MSNTDAVSLAEKADDRSTDSPIGKLCISAAAAAAAVSAPHKYICEY